MSRTSRCRPSTQVTPLTANLQARVLLPPEVAVAIASFVRMRDCDRLYGLELPDLSRHLDKRALKYRRILKEVGGAWRGS